MLLRLFLAALVLIVPSALPAQDSRLETHSIDAPSLEGNLIGLEPERNLRIYLPAGYDSSDRR